MKKKSFIAFVMLLTSFFYFKAEAETMLFNRPSQYKTTWQRLLLQLSTTYFTVVKENQVNLDSSLIYCARSLKLSRLPVITEGISGTRLAEDDLKWIDDRDPKSGIRLLSASTGKKHLQLLVLMGAYYAFEPDNYHRYKNQILYFLNSAIKESKAQQDLILGRQARLLIAKMYASGYDFKNGDAAFDQLIKECQATSDHLTEAKAWFYRGLYTAFIPSTTPKRIFCLERVQKLYHQQNNPEGEINALTDISYLYVLLYHIDKAYKASLEALRLAEEIHFPFRHYNTQLVSMVTILNGGFGEPLKYAFETIRIAEAAHDSIGLGHFYERVADLYYIENSNIEAIKWQEKAVYLLIKINRDNGLYRPVFNLVNYLILAHYPTRGWNILTEVFKKAPPQTLLDKMFYYQTYAVCCMQLKKYDIAEKYLATADFTEKQLEKNGYTFRRGINVFQSGELNFLKHNYAKARIIFEQYLSDPSMFVSGGLKVELNALDQLIRIDSIQEDNVSAVRHLKLYRKLADSNFVISKTRQAEELQVKYALAEEEDQIRLLNQKRKLEQSKLNRLTLIKDVTIGGIVLIAIIAGLLYRQSSIRKKNNELISGKNQLLEKLVTEKEWLLKEVHHRVKNNLHTVICLLESQAAYLKNDALDAIVNSRHRIYAMSLIHQKLYQSNDIKTVDMSLYLSEFLMYISDSFGTSGKLRFEYDIEPLELDVSYAVPLSLIINEAVTNAIKYAFPGDKKGIITIALRKSNEQVSLIIADNGIGINIEQVNTQSGSLGLKLLRGLSEEIKAYFSIENTHGTIIGVKFKVEQLMHTSWL
jgi:two-component sensor histidine kinase